MTKDKKLFETDKADRTQAVELEDATLDQVSGGLEPCCGTKNPPPKTTQPTGTGR